MYFYVVLQLFFIKHIMMKEIKEEEDQYCLSGWENREDNESYDEKSIKRLQQKEEIVINKKSQLAKLPYRTHFRTKSKEFVSAKLNEANHLKQDKQFLQQYLSKVNDFQLETHRLYLHDHSPECRIKYQTETLNSNNERHQYHKTTEVQVSSIKSPEIESIIPSQKQLLFSGNKEKKTRRKYLLKINHMESQQKSYKDANCLFRKRLIVPEKLSISRVDLIKEERYGVYRSYKKCMKFPLFYREVNSTEHSLTKSKNIASNVLQKQAKYLIKHSSEFMDNNIFSTQLIRA